MAECKIEIKVGAVSFSGEGDGKWLSEQLDKVLEKLPQLAKVAPAKMNDGGAGEGGFSETPKLSGTLAAYLKEKSATSNQVRKFLAAAIWLHDHDKKESLTTSDIASALSAARQAELTNPSQSLN